MGVSADLPAHKGNLIEVFPWPKASTSPVKLPKQGTHRAFQNPKDIERLGKGLPSKAQSSSRVPSSCGISGCSWHLFSLKHMGDFLREPVEMPIPGPPFLILNQ